MRALLLALLRARCALLGGHLPVTRRGGGRVQERCFLCDAALGPGWDVTDLRPPAGLPPVVERHATASWLQRRRRTA